MDYSLSPPDNLQERALIAAAISLFTKSPVKDEILRVFEYRSQYDFDDGWKKIEKAAKDRIEALGLPQMLKIELSGISKQISLEILEWAKYYGQYYCESAFLNNACWMPQGAIDAERTARKLVNDQSLSVLKRYKMACIHCFDDIVPDLWKQLGKSEEHLSKIKRNRRYDNLVVFWSYHMYGRSCEIIGGNSENEYGLNVSVDQGNSVAVKYFWQKLTSEEKERNLERCVITAAEKPLTGSGLDKDPRFPKSSYTNILCFLLNEISEEQQVKIFHSNVTKLNYNMLKSFLNFPYQSFFIPTAKCTLGLLENKECCFLLLFIAEEISRNSKIYGRLFRYIWQEIPNKESVINTWQVGKALSKLFEFRDYRSAELVLESTSVSVRGQFFFSPEGRNICCDLAKKGEWCALEGFINLCLVNEHTALKFKETEKISYSLLERGLKDNADRFNNLLDNFVVSLYTEPFSKAKGIEKKRKLESDNSTNKKVKTELHDNKVTKILASGMGLK